MGGFGKIPIKEGLEYIAKPNNKKMTRSKIKDMKFAPGNI